MTRKKQTPELDVETETLTEIGATEQEVKEHGTAEKIIAARTAEKQSLLARVAAEAPEEPTPPVVAGEQVKERAVSALEVLQALGGATDAARRRVNDERREELRAKAQPHLTAIRSATTAHGMLAARWLSRVEEVALLDWKSVYAAVPARLEMVPGASGRMNIDVNRQVLWRLQKAAESARGALLSTFGDAQPGRGDIDPVSAGAMAAAVEALLDGDGWLHKGTDTVSQDWKRASSHLVVWAQRATRIAESARAAVESFQAAEANARDLLAGLAPRVDTPPTPTRGPLPPGVISEKKPPEFAWSGDVRTLTEEMAEHAEQMKRYTPPFEPGSRGRGKIVGIVGGEA